MASSEPAQSKRPEHAYGFAEFVSAFCAGWRLRGKRGEVDQGIDREAFSTMLMEEYHRSLRPIYEGELRDPIRVLQALSAVPVTASAREFDPIIARAREALMDLGLEW